MSKNPEKKILSISQIIKYLIEAHPKFDPLTDGFDRLAFTTKLTEYLNGEITDSTEVTDNGGAIAILDLNEMYESIMAEIEEALNKINLDRMDMIKQLLLLSNFDAIFLNITSIKQFIEDDKNVPVEISEAMAGEIETINDEKVNIHDAADINIEVCNLLINIIARYNPKRDSSKPTLNEQDSWALLRKCMLFGNLLFNLKDAFEYFKHEFGELEKTENTIRFKHSPQYYSSLRRAGKDRFQNHMYENTIHLSNVFKDDPVPLPTAVVSNRRLTFNLSTTKKQVNRYRLAAAGLGLSYYFHVQTVKFQSLDNITIHLILQIIGDLQFLFATLNEEKFTNTEDTASIPYVINKKELSHQLHRLSGIKESTIAKVLASISTVIEENIDIWKCPFLSYGQDFYFNVNSIAKLHTAYIADQLINKFIPKDKHANLFTKYMGGEMMLEKKEKQLKRLTIGDHATLPKSLNDSLIFELETTYLLLEPCITPFTFNSKEYEQVLYEITECSFKLLDKKQELLQFLSDNTEKEIICIVVPIYPSLSGVIVNDCFTLDPILLNNYFATGAFKRGIVVMGQEKMESREMASESYYQNEREMSENLLLFCMRPVPIRQLLSTYKSEEIPLGLPGTSPAILQDSIHRIPLEDMIWTNVDELEYCMRQLFYFEKPLKKREAEKKIIEKKISFLLPSVMSAIAFQRDNTEARSRLLQIFKKVGFQGLDYLIESLYRSLAQLEGRKFKKSAPFKHIDYDPKKTSQDLLELVKSTHETGSQISLSTLKLTHSYPEEKVVAILEFLIDSLSSIGQRQYSSEELENHYIWIIFFSALTREQPAYKRFLSTIYFNFIDALNFNFQYQTARNFAEEVLIYSFEIEQFPFLGWSCLFKCYEKQKNVFDAAFYGALFTACVEISPNADEELVTFALYNAMLFFRDYRMPEIENVIYEVLNKFELSEYDTQKITLSHFSANLFRKPLDQQEEEFKQVKIYLEKNIESICKYSEKGAMPWLVLLYNIQQVLALTGKTFDKQFMDAAIGRLELELDKENLIQLQARFKPVQEVSKELFKDALTKIFQSLRFDDVAFELENLEPIARNVASLAIDSMDISSLLLTGLVINDQSLTFPEKEVGDTVPFINESTTEELKDYSSHILPKLQLQEGQVVIWLFNLYEKVYSLKIDYQGRCEITHLKNWSLKEMAKWLDSMAGFSFNDRGGDYFINEQERDYTDLAKKLSFAYMPLGEEVKEVFLYKNLTLAAFPHNLISIPISPGIYHQKHQDLIKEHIESQGTDFISLYKPVTDVVSLEWFAENHASVYIPAKDFSISSWIPTEDEDYALYIGYNKLVPLLEEQYGITISTKLVPTNPFNTTINIFMAHGGKGVEGFRTIYTKNEEGHAIIKENGIDRIMGNGIIAVLFICHSAYLSPELFAQRLVSLCHHVLSLGYKAVIAPAWSLNPIITPVWLEEFLNCLKKGLKVSECVLKANVKVMESGFNEHHGFYAPTGWAAMHLYGNPNIYFQ